MKKVMLTMLFVFLTSKAFAGGIETPSDQVANMSKLEQRIGALEKTIASQQTVIKEQTSQIQALQSVVAEKKPNETVYLPTKEELEKKVGVGYGKLTVGGLFQGWYSMSNDADDTARIRRTELKFAGEVNKDLRWTIMFDPSQLREDATRRSSLQDAYFTLGYVPRHKFDIGQFKIPHTEEGLRSSAKLETIERSFITRTFGDKRDIGIMMTGDWDWLMYQAGVFNGQEQNNLDVNDKKDLAWRAVLRPFRSGSSQHEVLKNVELGISQYYRNSNDSSVFTEKRRMGFEARWEYGRYSLKGEAAYGQTAAAPLWGWYTQGGYFLLPDKLQGVLKFDSFDQNERASEDRAHDLTAGLNYFLDSYHAKLQLNYVRREGQGSLDDNQILSAIQVAY